MFVEFIPKTVGFITVKVIKNNKYCEAIIYFKYKIII